MKTIFLFSAAIAIATVTTQAQDIKAKAVPEVVKSALAKKYPEATKVSWEKEKGTVVEEERAVVVVLYVARENLSNNV